MSKVIVDIDAFLNTAAVIDDYVANCKKRNNQLENILEELGTVWKGEDYQKYKEKYTKDVLDSSTSNKKTIEYLEKYSAYLRLCAEKYQNAQRYAQEKFKKC